MQSASASPGIAIAPRSVVQVRMPDDGSTGSGAGEGEAVSMVSAGEDVNPGGENESSEDDDEEEVDEINHAKLPREAIRAHSPARRPHKSAAWTYLRRIHKHDVPGHEMNADCTHVCVCPLSDCEEGVKRFCNEPLKLFRASKAPGAAWRASFFTPRGVGGGEGGVSAEPPTVAVSMNEPAPVQYDVMADLLYVPGLLGYAAK
jgi:hypothetical protein